LYLSSPDMNCQPGISEFPDIDAEVCGPPKVWPGDKSVPIPPSLHRQPRYLTCAIRSHRRDQQ
jgi:hypothetical protein